MKKFFIAVLVSVLMFSAQIAAAVDWNSVPHFKNKAELANYIENERRRGQTIFHVVLTNGLKVDTVEDFANLAIVYRANISGIRSTDGTAKMTYNITEYPGTRVANAYLSRNQQQAWMNLTAEEQKLYNIAVGIVDEANKRPSEREKAEYIHKAICNLVDISETTEYTTTAINALIYKKSDCEGYTDAFYMLGRMTGLKVGRIRGHLDKSLIGHAWNWITFSDGKSYCIDVTLDDTYNSYNWFLKTRSHMEKTHRCEWEIIPNMQ